MPKVQPKIELLYGDCLPLMRKMADKSVDLVLGSPPYAGKGERYGTNWVWDADKWLSWMLDVTWEAIRIARNVVVWVVNGFVKDGRYNPVCEGLVYRSYEENGIRCERPVVWHKNAPPSKRPWFSNDWEYCLAFRPDDSTEYFDWEAIAAEPLYKAGGNFRQRGKNGQRVEGGSYPTNKLTRPRDVIRATVGGGHLGSKLAHKNEAPYPEKLIEPFIQTLVPKGGCVLDPFCGSGTTLAVAKKFGRNAIGIDCRQNQIDLARLRLQEPQYN